MNKQHGRLLVKGPQSLLKALIEELSKKEYSPFSGKEVSHFSDEVNSIVITEDGSYYKHRFTFREYNTSHFDLPKDWDTVIEIISKTTQPRFKVGDFITNLVDSFWTVKKIDLNAGVYELENEILGLPNDKLTINNDGWELVTESEVLNLLKKHYFKKLGLSEYNSRVIFGGVDSGKQGSSILQYVLTKNIQLTTLGPYHQKGTSQLSFKTEYNHFFTIDTTGIHFSTEGMIQIDGLKVKKMGELVSINSKLYTKDTLLLLKNILTNSIKNKQHLRNSPPTHTNIPFGDNFEIIKIEIKTLDTLISLLMKPLRTIYK